MTDKTKHTQKYTQIYDRHPEVQIGIIVKKNKSFVYTC